MQAHVPNDSICPSPIPPALRDGGCLAVEEGYVTGLIGRITSLEAAFYREHWQLGRRFEGVIATGLSEFFNRYEAGVDAFFKVMHHANDTGCMASSCDAVMGSLAVDRSGRERPGEVSLRWFFLHPSLHGHGLGKALMARAVGFARETGAREMVVETFEGLGAACSIYESFGFVLESRWEGVQWGRLLPERRYRLIL
ncbi:GNAT family N-acetyltransferase [Desulfoluna spongiiphila]|uniref:Acetyltransferase (GNAT) family protein n=1 Tax=Desulfoluna spongiiphila TaxID=419481 RepID=A0A1G5HSB5_9BACT|nr:GNAT family N-acetyltransferase [Desulfoluna spongiiphila]SCY66190.1 Acetyltransferase (GNAT) family protein [Desulfoluna spongiiphila]